MKKAIIVCLLFVGSLRAQVTLTQSNHAPAAGDSYQTYQCDSLNVVPGPSGAGQNWNYVIATHSSVISNFVASSNSNPNYSAATVSVSAPGNNTGYFDSDATTKRYYGGHSVIPQQADVHLYFTTPAVFAVYPMTLNTATTTVVAGSVTLIVPISTSGTFTGTIKVIADASGTLSLPGITYNNILRIVNTQTIDCTTGFGNGVIYQEIYDYYQAGIKPPVFTISSATLSTPLGDDYQFIVSRLVPPANTVGMAEIKTNQSCSLFPNPAFERISISGEIGTIGKVTFKGIDGSLKAMMYPDGDNSINVSSLAQGIYIYEVTNSAGKLVSTGKQVIIR